MLAHLRAGPMRVREGERVAAGQELANCGNSGNSKQPHLHIQAMDAADPLTAGGLPMTFRSYQTRRRSGPPVTVEQGMPDESEIVEPLDAAAQTSGSF